MDPNELRPASGRTEERGAGGVPGGKPQQNSRSRKAKPELTVRKLPDGEPFTVRGRPAQTLAHLLAVGAKGFTSGDASPLGWARRTSHYIWRLREVGLDIATTREDVGDANVARYVLLSPVAVVSDRGVL